MRAARCVRTCKLVGIYSLCLLVGVSSLCSAQTATSPSDQSPAAQESVAEIDRQIATAWSEYGLQPSAKATDGEWCRRLYLDVLGRIPSIEELGQFIKDRSADRREKLVDRLLYDDEYVVDFARNWTTIWTNLLIGRTGGTDRRDLGNREGMQQYLRNCFANSKPYDRFAEELITATGATKPGKEGFNGATNFLANKLGESAAQATTKTSQLFLGVQVQCTQCHNHPFNEWKQSQFWGMNAFFRQTRALRRFQSGTRDLDYAELIDQDFAGEGASPESAEIYYEQRNGKLHAMFPEFVDGQKLENPSGYVNEVNRRDELAKLITRSDHLAKAQANRMWAHFMGYGFTKPYDDLGPHNPVTHPELLDYLAAQFKDSEYDQKKLIRWIVLSRPYGLSSRATDKNRQDDPQLGETPKFSRFYLRQMRAEELYESLLVATRADSSGDYKSREAAKARWLAQFNRAFGTDEGGETTTFDGSIPQALMMFNGELIRSATRVDGASFLAKVAKGKESPKLKIQKLYLAALSRKPTKKEVKLADKLLAARASDYDEKGDWKKNGQGKGKPEKVDPIAAALQDVWWAILNSNEFIMNH